jgi:hypothetical protein
VNFGVDKLKRWVIPWSLILLSTLSSFSQGTAFLYQGSLSDNAHPAAGTYDLTFTLYDSSSLPGNIVGGTITNLGIGINNGYFNVTLDFGSVFDGTARWMQIGVRTNGGTNFVTLNPRQPVTPVPYAMFSGSATNVVGALTPANLAPVTSMIASSSNALYSALQSALSTNLASFTNNGLESYEDAVLQASVPYQQAGIQQTPIRGYLTWYATGSNPTEAYVSNIMFTTKSTGLYNYGYHWIFIDDGWGSTNRDANGNVQWNTNKFPSGSNFVNIVHQMGFKLGLYTDGGNPDGLTTSGSQAASDAGHIVQDVNQFLNWGVDGGKWDVPVLNLELGASALATNTAKPFYLICGDVFVDRVVNARWVSMMNAFRGIADGDLTSFRSLLAWCDEYDTNGFYRWIGPGHVYDFDGIGANADVEPGTFRGSQGQIVMDAISSGVMLHSLSDNNGRVGTLGASYQLTNSSVLEIQADPAVIAGQRVMQTNNVDVWLKPLGSAVGPQFAVGLICRSASSNITVTIPFDSSGLNLPVMQPGAYPAGYSVYDCISNLWLSPGPSSSVTMILTNHQSALLRLYPGAAVTTNYLQPFIYAPTLSAIVNSNGMQRVVNLPWDADATNFIARAQIANDPIQCYAIQVLFTKLKSVGLWTNRLDVLYPIIPAQPYLNAFSTNFTIVPVGGGVTTNSQGIAGDGISSYFNTGYHFVTNATHLSVNSASIGLYNGTALPTGIVLMGNFDGTNQIALINSPGAIYANVNDINASYGLGNSGNCAGLLVVSRISAATSYIYGRTGLIDRGLPTVAVPNSFCFLDAETRGFVCNAQLRGAWIGGGLTPPEMATLNDIWEQYESILGRQAP